jgi:phosphate starvation-inducible PhoH-like protein
MSKTKHCKERSNKYKEQQWDQWFEKSNNSTEDECKKGKISTIKFINPITDHQRRFVKSIKNNFITFGVGYPGTGKTLLALHTAIYLFNSEESNIDKILYVRANVGAAFEKEIGALPGELQDKTLFMADPIMDNLLEFMTESSAKLAIQAEKIQVRPVDLARGRSLSNAIIIIEEAQNIPMKYLAMLITRASMGSKLIIIGDTQQVDLVRHESGLTTCINKLKPLESKIPMEIVLFNNINDIQRHPHLQEIIVSLMS